MSKNLKKTYIIRTSKSPEEVQDLVCQNITAKAPLFPPAYSPVPFYGFIRNDSFQICSIYQKVHAPAAEARGTIIPDGSGTAVHLELITPTEGTRAMACIWIAFSCLFMLAGGLLMITDFLPGLLFELGVLVFLGIGFLLFRANNLEAEQLRKQLEHILT